MTLSAPAKTALAALAIASVGLAPHIANASPKIIPASEAGKLRAGDTTTVLKCWEDDSCRISVVYVVRVIPAHKTANGKRKLVTRVLASTSWCQVNGYCQEN